MAVGFKTSEDYGYSLLPLFGVDQNIINKAKAAGVEVSQSSPGTFTIKIGDQFFGSVLVKGSAISLAKTGGLGPASKQALKYNFEAAMNKAITKGVGLKNFEPGTGNPVKNFHENQALETIFEEEESLLAKPEPLKAEHPPSGSDPDKIMKQLPVKLYTAKHCYQPVLGTSNGSIYYVVAMYIGLAVALRVKNSKVSFRAEGAKLKNYQSALADLGFSVKDDYASVHFDISDKALILKTVGAVVGRLGLTGVQSVADPMAIVGAL